MTTSFLKPETRTWFDRPGPESDAVLSTQLKLVRNVNGFPYPGFFSDEQETELNGKFKDIICDHDTGLDFIALADIPKSRRGLLYERRFTSQEFLRDDRKTLAVNDAGGISCIFNDRDHINIVCLESGYSVGNMMPLLYGLDDLFDSHIVYAFNFDQGYMTGKLRNSGTGLQISILLHLPVLVFTDYIEKALKKIMDRYITVQGYLGEDEHSLGSLYQVKNCMAAGISEDELSEKLDGCIRQLLNYEREIAAELHDTVDLQDRVMRSFGILSYCRKITYREAVGALSDIRLGVRMGWLKCSMEKINALLFRSQDEHVRSFMKNDEADPDFLRAEYLRRAMNAVTVDGGSICSA